MALGNLPLPGRPKIWIVGQGSTALAVVVSGVDWTFFLSSILSLLCLSLFGRRPDIDCNTSQRAIKPTTTDQPSLLQHSFLITRLSGSPKVVFIWRTRIPRKAVSHLPPTPLPSPQKGNDYFRSKN